MIERVAEHFGLGRLRAEPARVTGGLSNEMWRATTDGGDFAIKRMVVNAGHPAFVGNVESAFHVEHRAWVAGVPMPEPVPDPNTGQALARIDGALYRVHRWVDGRTGEGRPEQAAELLASIHAVGRPRWESAPRSEWDAHRWGPELAALASRVSLGPERLLIVDSHGDLDRKNTLLRPTQGELVALDWDAAGPVGAVHEAVGLALDWAGTDRQAFGRALAVYQRRSGVTVEAEPWVFAGWVAALGGWLDYNADHRANEDLGRAEITATSSRLRSLADDLDSWIAAITDVERRPA